MVNLKQSRAPATFDVVRRDLDRWFDQFFSPEVRNFGGNGQQAWRAPASLWEDENFFYLEVEMPGVESDAIDVTLEKGTLAIAAERKAPSEERKYWHQDRSFGRLRLNVNLPETVDGDSIEAELKSGVLHLRLAKRPEAQPKKITVKTAE